MDHTMEVNVNRFEKQNKVEKSLEEVACCCVGFCTGGG